MKLDGEDAASDTEHTNTSLLIVLPPAAPNKAMAAAGSDDDVGQFDVARVHEEPHTCVCAEARPLGELRAKQEVW